MWAPGWVFEACIYVYLWAARKTDRGARCHMHFAYQMLSFTSPGSLFSVHVYARVRASMRRKAMISQHEILCSGQCSHTLPCGIILNLFRCQWLKSRENIQITVLLAPIRKFPHFPMFSVWGPSMDSYVTPEEGPSSGSGAIQSTPLHPVGNRFEL